MKNLLQRLCLLLFAFFGSASPIHAQDTAAHNDEKFRHAVGIGAGFSTGYGLSYRYQPKKLGVQLNFAPFKDEEKSRYSAGLTFIYPLIPGKTTTLFLYQANHFYYNSWTAYYTDDNLPASEPTEHKEKVTDSYINNGLGIGFEIIFAKRIGFNIMMGYAAYVNFTQVNVTAESGLYFKF